MDQELRASFFAHLRADAAIADGPALEAGLRARLEAGRAAWPTLSLDAHRFVAFLAARTEEAELPPLEHAADLYIACACAGGVDGAVALLDGAFGDMIRRVLARRDGSRELADDAQQVLRERLFVGSADARPKIADYAGRAPLRSWLAAAASRTLIDLRRRVDAKREEPGSGMRSLADDAEPELQYLKERYRKEFAEAVRAAVAHLSQRDRALLKLNLVQGMSIDRLGAVYNVGRSTAARWLSAARQALHEETRRELCARLSLSPSEYESLAALVRSDLDVSAATLLGS
jgi:RNA polymerase sigma-70 factor (ECF subfamily)